MKQIVMNAYGATEVLELMNIPTPSPKAGELLIEVTAAGVNFSDILRRKNTYFMPTPTPYVLGAEVVGIVSEVGEEHLKERFPKGSKVLAILPAGGGYASHVVAEATYCIPLPPHVDSKQATAIFVQGSTAHLLLHQVAPKVADKTVLIHAAAGGVGSIWVQLAKLAGAKVIAASSNQQKLAKAKELGADILVDYTQADWVEQLIAQNDGKKVDVIFEMVGGKIYEQCIEALNPGGSLVVYGSASGQNGYIHSERFVDENQQLLSFNLAHYIQHQPQVWQAALGEVIGLLASQKLQIAVPHVYPLEAVKQAHQDLENRKTIGKVVLTT